MRRFQVSSLQRVTLVVLLISSLLLDAPVRAAELTRLKKFLGTIDFTTEELSTFTLEGKTRELGRFTAYGEIEFVPGPQLGSLIGAGVAVFEAANGDLLVGVVSCEVEKEVAGKGEVFRTSRIQFSWRDEVEFNDGTIVTNTGRFVHDRPPGLVVIAIIAILAAILFPVFAKA